MDPLHGLLFSIILAIFALLHHRFSRFEKMLEQVLHKPPTEPKAATNDTALPESTPLPVTKKPAFPEEDVFEVTQRLAKAGAEYDDEDERTKIYDSRR